MLLACLFTIGLERRGGKRGVTRSFIKGAESIAKVFMLILQIYACCSAVVGVSVALW